MIKSAVLLALVSVASCCNLDKNAHPKNFAHAFNTQSWNDFIHLSHRDSTATVNGMDSIAPGELSPETLQCIFDFSGKPSMVIHDVAHRSDTEVGAVGQFKWEDGVVCNFLMFNELEHCRVAQSTFWMQENTDGCMKWMAAWDKCVPVPATTTVATTVATTTMATTATSGNSTNSSSSDESSASWSESSDSDSDSDSSSSSSSWSAGSSSSWSSSKSDKTSSDASTSLFGLSSYASDSSSSSSSSKACDIPKETRRLYSAFNHKKFGHLVSRLHRVGEGWFNAEKTGFTGRISSNQWECIQDTYETRMQVTSVLRWKDDLVMVRGHVIHHKLSVPFATVLYFDDCRINKESYWSIADNQVWSNLSAAMVSCVPEFQGL